MKTLIALAIVGVLGTGVYYTWKQEQTLFKKSDLKFGGLTVHVYQQQIVLKMALDNQTDISLDITGHDLQAFINNDLIGSSKSDVSTHIAPRSITPLPYIVINVQTANILNDLLATRNNSQVTITGMIYGKKYFIPFSYPVNYKVSLADLLSSLI